MLKVKPKARNVADILYVAHLFLYDFPLIRVKSNLCEIRMCFCDVRHAGGPTYQDQKQIEPRTLVRDGLTIR